MASEDLLFYRDRILERIEKLRSFLNDHQPVMAELMTVGDRHTTRRAVERGEPHRGEYYFRCLRG